MENLINIGTIVGTHHLLGTVKVNSIFADIDVILNESVLVMKNDDMRILTIKKIKQLNAKKLLIDFETISTVEEAKKLNNYQIKIRRDLLPEKQSDEYYYNDLLGVSIFEYGKKIGEVINTLETAAHNIIIVQIENGKEIMIPMVEAFIKKIDFDNNRIDVELIDGMKE